MGWEKEGEFNELKGASLTSLPNVQCIYLLEKNNENQQFLYVLWQYLIFLHLMGIMIGI